MSYPPQRRAAAFASLVRVPRPASVGRRFGVGQRSGVGQRFGVGRRSGRRMLVSVAAAALLVPLLAAVSGPASADTAPLPPVTTPTVSADSLPTAQIGQGVVWDQEIVGNTVY